MGAPCDGLTTMDEVARGWGWLAESGEQGLAGEDGGLGGGQVWGSGPARAGPRALGIDPRPGRGLRPSLPRSRPHSDGQ